MTSVFGMWGPMSCQLGIANSSGLSSVNNNASYLNRLFFSFIRTVCSFLLNVSATSLSIVGCFVAIKARFRNKSVQDYIDLI